MLSYYKVKDVIDSAMEVIAYFEHVISTDKRSTSRGEPEPIGIEQEGWSWGTRPELYCSSPRGWTPYCRVTDIDKAIVVQLKFKGAAEIRCLCSRHQIEWGEQSFVYVRLPLLSGSDICRDMQLVDVTQTESFDRREISDDQERSEDVQ
jgi:hypothetical protein